MGRSLFNGFCFDQMQSESGRRNDMNNIIGRRLLFAGIGFLILGIAATASAQVDVYYDHGTTCQPGFNVFTQTAYGEPGIGNFSNSSEARVFCPMNRARPQPCMADHKN